MTGSTRAGDSDGVDPSIEQLSDPVREVAEEEIDGDLDRAVSYTCRECGTTEYAIYHDTGVENIVDREVGDIRMHHLSDTSAGAFHLDGNDAEDPYMCDSCFDDVRFRGSLVVGVLPTGERTGYRVEGQVVAYPYWELETAPRDTPLDEALRTAVDTRAGDPTFEGEEMVDISDSLSDEHRETIASGAAGIHAIVHGSWGPVFVPEREIDTALERGQTVTVDELPESLQVEDGVVFKIHHATPESALGFDCTGFGNAETFRTVLDSVGLDADEDHYRVPVNHDGRVDAMAHVWVNDGVMIQTGNDPLSGEHGKHYADRPAERGYAGMIGIEGREYPVGKLFRAVKRHAIEIKDVDATGRGFL